MQHTKEVRFKIGEVASIFDISVRTLRLYDKIGLFQPKYVDPQNGYRYYLPEQIYTLNAIISLKSLGIRLLDIKSIMDDNMDPHHLITILENQRLSQENQIAVAQYNIENIDRILTATKERIEDYKEKEISDEMAAFRMSRLVCLESTKSESLLSEVLWL